MNRENKKQPLNVRIGAIYVTDEQSKWLISEQERTGATISEITRRAMDLYRKSREEKQ